ITDSFQLTHLDDVEVGTEGGALPGQIGVYIEHTSVIMTDDTHVVPLQRFHYFHRVEPAFNLIPYALLLQKSGDDLIPYSSFVEHAGDLRYGTCLAMLKP